MYACLYSLLLLLMCFCLIRLADTLLKKKFWFVFVAIAEAVLVVVVGAERDSILAKVATNIL